MSRLKNNKAVSEQPKQKHRSIDPELDFSKSDSNESSPVEIDLRNAGSLDQHAALLGDTSSRKLSDTLRRAMVVRQLQSNFGNRYVSRLLDHVSRRNSTGVQAKMAVGPAGDRYEREADHIAKQVLGQIKGSGEQPVQRQGTEGEDASLVQMKPLQRQIGMEGGDVSGDVEASIDGSRGSGRPIDENVRRSMEGAFGADFSDVRVHSGSESTALNDSMSARAFTTGKDIFFRQGEYNPGSDAGKEILAHELTHVVQQTSPLPTNSIATREMQEPEVQLENDSMTLEKSAPVDTEKITPTSSDHAQRVRKVGTLKGPKMRGEPLRGNNLVALNAKEQASAGTGAATPVTTPLQDHYLGNYTPGGAEGTGAAIPVTEAEREHLLGNYTQGTSRDEAGGTTTPIAPPDPAVGTAPDPAGAETTVGTAEIDLNPDSPLVQHLKVGGIMTEKNALAASAAAGGITTLLNTEVGKIQTAYTAVAAESNRDEAASPAEQEAAGLADFRARHPMMAALNDFFSSKIGEKVDELGKVFTAIAAISGVTDAIKSYQGRKKEFNTLDDLEKKQRQAATPGQEDSKFVQAVSYSVKQAFRSIVDRAMTAVIAVITAVTAVVTAIGTMLGGGPVFALIGTTTAAATKSVGYARKIAGAARNLWKKLMGTQGVERGVNAGVIVSTAMAGGTEGAEAAALIQALRPDGLQDLLEGSPEEIVAALKMRGPDDEIVAKLTNGMKEKLTSK